jgi:ankyrin repeat protein
LAAVVGYLESVRLLLAKGAPVDQLSSGLWPGTVLGASGTNTALSAAAWFGTYSAVEVLLDAGAELNPTDRLGPLQLAAAKGSLNMVAFLVERGANVRAHADCGFSALQFALEAKAFDCAEFLIRNGADVNEYSEWRGKRAWPFVTACELAGAGTEDSVKAAALAELMVAKGLNPHSESVPPPAVSAMMAGLAGIAEMLVLNGASLF